MNMKQQAMNPFLPSYEYIPDGEPHIFEGRIYLYGSHDRFDGASFCLNDYVTYSCPGDDLSSGRYEGVIFQKKQDPKPGHSLLSSMFAPDVCKGADGRYYLYYFIGYRSEISVAVSSSPKGPFSYYGKVAYSDGTPLGKKGESLQFDPGVFVDEDGRIYLYTGFGPKHRSLFMLSHRPSDEVTGFELSSDMKTIKDSFSISVPSVRKSKGTSYEGHAFFEASSMRKFQGRYYFIYSSELGHELCYAMSSSPRGPFEYKGTLVSIGDIGLGNHSDPKSACNFTGNTHGSVLEVNGEYYVFYHRQTNRHQFSRQACAEKLFMREDGTFSQARVTSSGLNGKPLCGIGKYETRIACVLKKKGGNRFYSIFKGRKGKNLDAIQLIANVFAGNIDPDIKVVVDSEDYRMRHEEQIVRNAYKTAEIVRRTGKSRLLDPMNPFERRLVHTALNEFEGVETKSEGEGLYKQVRIIPVK